MINLEWFRTFKAIYETGTLSAAAQTLYISQPGVSLHLNSLESHTGFRLFEREPRRMVPTDRGVMLYNYIILHVNKLEEAEHLFLKGANEERACISVGMCFETFQYALEQHIAQLPFNLVTRFGEYPQMLRDLETGALDLIVTPQRNDQPVLDYTPFTKERIVLICGSQTDTEQLDKFLLVPDLDGMNEWLREQIWYATAADMEHLKNFWTINFGHAPGFKANYVVPYFGSILQCLSNGKGFAVIPDFLCKKDLEKKAIRLVWEGKEYLENTLYFGKRKKTIYANEIQELEAIIAKSWQ